LEDEKSVMMDTNPYESLTMEEEDQEETKEKKRKEEKKERRTRRTSCRAGKIYPAGPKR